MKYLNAAGTLAALALFMIIAVMLGLLAAMSYFGFAYADLPLPGEEAGWMYTSVQLLHIIGTLLPVPMAIVSAIMLGWQSWSTFRNPKMRYWIPYLMKPVVIFF